DDVAHGVSTARRVALARAIRREHFGAGELRHVAHRVLGDRHVDRDLAGAHVRHDDDLLAAARLDFAARAERLKDALRVLRAMALIGVAGEILERVLPRREIARARAALLSEICEDERARAETEVGVATNVVFTDAEKLRAEGER